jgi:putative heme-binding domain-containing protein
VQGERAKGDVKAYAAVAAGALRDGSPVVRRRGAEALVRMGQAPDRPSLAPAGDIYALLGHDDRFVRWAGRIALERTPLADWRDRALNDTNILSAPEATIALVNMAGPDVLPRLVERSFAMMKTANLSPEARLRLFRAFQYTAAQVQGGLSAADRERLHGLVVEQFPAADERLNRELALLLAYAGQPQGIAKILAAMPRGDENQPLQLHYLYALRTVKEGWTAGQKAQLAELLGRASAWRGGAQFINFVGQMFDAVQPLFASAAEQALLYEKAPDFSPLTPEQLEEIKAKLAASGRGGGRGNLNNPLAARRAGRVVSRQEMLEEAVFQPQQNLNVQAGREVFERSCASCHRFDGLGTNHGVPALDLTRSKLRESKYTLLEAVMIPDRHITQGLGTTVVTRADGTTVRGVALRETPQAVALLTADGTVTEVPRGPGVRLTREARSIMSEAASDEIGQAQLRNLAAFLTASPAAGDGR